MHSHRLPRWHTRRGLSTISRITVYLQSAPVNTVFGVPFSPDRCEFIRNLLLHTFDSTHSTLFSFYYALKIRKQKLLEEFIEFGDVKRICCRKLLIIFPQKKWDEYSVKEKVITGKCRYNIESLGIIQL